MSHTHPWASHFGRGNAMPYSVWSGEYRRWEKGMGDNSDERKWGCGVKKKKSGLEQTEMLPLLRCQVNQTKKKVLWIYTVCDPLVPYLWSLYLSTTAVLQQTHACDSTWSLTSTALPDLTFNAGLSLAQPQGIPDGTQPAILTPVQAWKYKGINHPRGMEWQWAMGTNG